MEEKKKERIFEEIMRVEKSEMVVEEREFNDEELRKVLDMIGKEVKKKKEKIFESEEEKKRIKKYLKVEKIDGLGKLRRKEIYEI